MLTISILSGSGKVQSQNKPEANLSRPPKSDPPQKERDSSLLLLFINIVSTGPAM